MNSERILVLLEEALSNPLLREQTRRRLEAGQAVVARVSARHEKARAGRLKILPNEASRSVSEPQSTPQTPVMKPRSSLQPPKPLEIVWKHPCRRQVSLYGTFTEPPWTEIPMKRDPHDGYFKVDLSDWGLSPGTYVFKFVVDGQWRVDPTLPTRQDLNGHVNNTMFVRSSIRPLKTVRSAPTVETISSSCSSSNSRTGSPPIQAATPISRGLAPHPHPSFTSHYFAKEYDSVSSERQTTSLSLICGGWMIPHPEKIASGGADSFFFSSTAAGVADGVGEWEWRFKLDPRKFAEQLMKGCLLSAEKHREDPCSSSEQAELKALTVLSEGFDEARAFGSSTACVMTLDDSGERIGVANLGDSGLIHFRKQFLTGALSMTCVMRTREQQHGFNIPYQLSRLPEPEQYEEISHDPIYTELISTLRTLSGRQLSKIDQAVDADLYSSRVKEGDLIILATDGVLDNLWNYDLLSVVGESAAVSPFDARIHFVEDGPTDPELIAKAVANAAYEKSILGGGYKSPFGVECRKRTGAVHLGGKMDDITVVACWVCRSEDSDAFLGQIQKNKANKSVCTNDSSSTCRDWWKRQIGRARNTSLDDVRKTSKYERFITNEPIQ
jgi:serine/threonine protein phosphatase PrpC